MYKRLFATIFCLLTVLLSFSQEMDFQNVIADSDGNKTILIVYSYDFNNDRLREFSTGFTSYISNKKIKVNLRFLNLNPDGSSSVSFKTSRVLKSIRTTYRNGGIDVIVCLDPDAQSSIILSLKDIEKNIPIISCYSAGTISEKLPGISNVTTSLFFEENFQLGLSLFPKVQEVLVLTDDAPYGDMEQKFAKMRLSKYKRADLNIKYLSSKNLTYKAYIDSINNISPNSFIILSTWLLDGAGNYKIQNEYRPFMSLIKNIPIIGSQNLSLGTGVLGGYLVSSWEIGNKLAFFSNKLLSSKDSYFNLNISENILGFDYNLMQKWRIKPEDLPKGAKIINKPASLLEDYKYEVISALGLFCVLILSLVIFILYHLRYRRLTNDNLRLTKENSDRKNLLDNTLSVMNEGVITFNNKLEIIDINQAAKEKIFSKVTVLGSRFEEVFSTSYLESSTPIEQMLNRTLECKEVSKISKNTRLFYNDSQYMDIEGDISPVLDSDGSIKQIVLVFRDLTELLQQKRFLNLAVESAKTYTWHYSADSDLFELGENYEKIFGSNLKRICSHEEFLLLVHPDDKPKLQEYFSQIKKNDLSSFSVEYRLSVLNDGRYEWWERRGLVSRGSNQDISFVLLYGMDINIDAHKEKENELLSAKLQAEESDKLKSAFLSNMSHEIRTPLNGIIGFANLIVDPDYSNSEKLEFSKVINTNSKVLMGLINDILDLSKIESNSMNFEMSECNLTHQLIEITESYNHSMSPNVKLIVETPDISVSVIVDQLRNRQIVTNLINNSIKFTESGYIKVGYNIKDTYIEVYVSDTGKGITKDHLEKIFRRFYKIDNFTIGTGLGLSICKAIVEKFGGKIWAESDQGIGTTMKYTIPLFKLEDNPEKVEFDEPLETEIVYNSIDDDSEKKTILIAEDLDSNYKLLEVLLSKKYNLVRALNGLEAVNIYKEINPPMILMDIKMPVMDGIQATKEIREISSNVIIVAQTANAFESDMQKAMSAGCNAFITKPIKGTSLIELINKLFKTGKG